MEHRNMNSDYVIVHTSLYMANLEKNASTQLTKVNFLKWMLAAFFHGSFIAFAVLYLLETSGE